jgi:glycerol-3-phosphate dehydrogenase
VLPALTRAHALLLTARRDGRVFFVIPWGSLSLVGTTDVDDDTPPARVAPAAEDIRYLLEETARVLPSGTSRPLRAFAGLRSLAHGSASAPWANSRELRIVREGSMLTLLGGKYTTHRSLAKRVVDEVVRATGARAGRCLTAELPLTGRAEAIALLTGKFPARADLGDGLEITEAETVHAIRSERARHLDDVLKRRSRLWLEEKAMRDSAEPVSHWMAPHLGWSEAARAREVERVQAALAHERSIVESANPGRSS